MREETLRGKYFKSGTELSEIKSNITEDINSAIKNKQLFPIKFTIKKEYFSQGRELKLIIRESSKKLLDEKGLDTPDFIELKEKINVIAQDYNYIEEDVQSDYWATSFYFNILLAPSFYKRE